MYVVCSYGIVPSACENKQLHVSIHGVHIACATLRHCDTLLCFTLGVAQNMCVYDITHLCAHAHIHTHTPTHVCVYGTDLK